MGSFIKLFWGIIYATISGFDSGYATKNVSYDKKVLWNCALVANFIKLFFKIYVLGGITWAKTKGNMLIVAQIMTKRFYEIVQSG
jgi:hypothetical protein